MESDETIVVSGRIVAEFEDDASQFLAGGAEFVRTPETPSAVSPSTPNPPTNGAVQSKSS